MKTLNKTRTFLSVLVIITCMFVTVQAQNNKLTELVWNNDLKDISTLLSNGYDVNQTDKMGNTALMLASRIGDHRLLEVLLSYGADVNKANIVGITGLMLAAKYDNAHAVDMLLQKGANPLFKSKKGYKASTFAYGFKHYPLYEKLMDAERNAEKVLKKQKKDK